MKDFFAKHGGSSDPSDAVDILFQKILRVREKVYAGDKSHLQDLKELSDMIDDYVAQAQGQKFEAKPIRNYVGGYDPNQQRGYDRDYDRSGRMSRDDDKRYDRDDNYSQRQQSSRSDWGRSDTGTGQTSSYGSGRQGGNYGSNR